jgi:glycosyltransferase involved in cell wall biosynthesis
VSSATEPRILLSAYQCGPDMGSVSQIGWEWFSRLAARAPTTLVTHVRNRPALQAAGAEALGEIIYIDTEWFARRLYKLACRLFPRSEHAAFLLASLDFFLYDWLAVRRLRPRRDEWDLVHGVTPVTTSAPTRLHRLGLPVVLGPLNAGLDFPPAFAEIMRQESTWLYRIRCLGRFLDWGLGSSRRIHTFFSATASTRASLPASHRHRSISMLENGVDLKRFSATPWPTEPGPDVPLRLLFVGRLIAFKALPLLLKAVTDVRGDFPVHLRVVGDGPMRQEWEELSRSLGLEDCVEFLGQQNTDAVAGHMRWCHLFCLPSVRESGGAVLLEAMAAARPVAAVAYGGPGEIVDEDVGRAVLPRNPQTVRAGFATIMRQVVGRPHDWRQRGLEGRRRAETQYSWDSKITSAIQHFRSIIDANPACRSDRAA